jgi:hypothetical protein
MALFMLDFQGTEFAIPKDCPFYSFERQPELVAKANYEVQTIVPREVFDTFVEALKTGGKVPVTKENVGVILLLAKEFSLDIFGSFDVRPGCFLLKEDKPLDGIISYLTRKYGGNVHEKGIVTITSKSVVECDHPPHVSDLADLHSNSHFTSRNEPGQWVCWDFHELRVRPTHYTIYGPNLRSWMLESSLDGETWIEFDRKTDTDDLEFDSDRLASFACSKWTECRFIRLTQTDKNHDRNDYLMIEGFEFFGTLIE